MECLQCFQLLNGFFSLKYISIPFLLLSSLVYVSCTKEDAFEWPDQKKAAICLTYDDALSTHLDIALPQLNQFNLKATFFCTGNSNVLQERSNEWLQIVQDGHELANHTYLHPCRKIKPGRDTLAWIKPTNDLNTYTVRRLMDELTKTNDFLYQLDGKTRRTFAYPCSDYLAGGESYISALDSICSAARSEGAIPTNLQDLNLFYMPSVDASSKSGAELIQLAEEALKNETLTIFMFHGVGGDYLQVSDTAHSELLQYLAQHQDDYWVDTFQKVTDYLQFYNE